MKRLFILLLIILLTGCAGAETAYDYDLSEYVQPGEYTGINYYPFGEISREYVEPYDKVTAELIALVGEAEELFAGVYTFEVGYSGFLDGFDEALCGLALDSPVTLNLTLPAVYEQAPQYAGRDVEIQVRILEIDMSYYIDTNTDALWDIVLDNSTVLKYPEKELQAYEADFLECYEGFAKEYSMELDDYLMSFFGVDSSKLAELCRMDAETSVKRDMVMYSIFREEELTISSDELEIAKADWLITYGYESESDMPAKWSDEAVRTSLDSIATLNMVKDFIYENAAELER